MLYKDNQVKLISDAVMEQLGIEEDEDYIEEELFTFDALNDKIKTLEKSIEEKDAYIHKLEVFLVDESKRIDLLERKFYEFKKRVEVERENYFK